MRCNVLYLMAVSIAVVLTVVMWVCFGDIIGCVVEEHQDWDDGKMDDWVDQTHAELKAQNELLQGWNKARFDCYARDMYPPNANGTNLFDRLYEEYPERIAQIETMLGCDFSDPNSWNQTHVDQHAQELQDAIRHHEAEYEISEDKLYDSQAVQAKSEWTRSDALKALADYENSLPKEDKFPGLTPDLWASADPQMPAHHARAGVNMFMATTICAAAGTGMTALVPDSNDDEHNPKSLGKRIRKPSRFVALMMMLIIIAAVVVGVNGMSGNFDERNEHFLHCTRYVMFALPGLIFFTVVGTAVCEFTMEKLHDNAMDEAAADNYKLEPKDSSDTKAHTPEGLRKIASEIEGSDSKDSNRTDSTDSRLPQDSRDTCSTVSKDRLPRGTPSRSSTDSSRTNTSSSYTYRRLLVATRA